ncbi:peptidoglycan D,D-transpeptidase FtsI family protein [Paenibacillus solisilvae]|uniref:Peptidoglycan D,D-transpeptidase FtsI family protein n=1 Tax=Paenibacillus solisilvae TaxID=2486751 RepID=A0ABW0W020_9BACL
MSTKERRMERNRRVFVVLLAMSFIILLLMFRLAWLQLIPAAPASARSADWKREAVAQRERGLVLDSGRGDFLDRNGESITGETYKALAVFPLQAHSRGLHSADFAGLAHALNCSEKTLEEWMRGLREPAFWQAKDERSPHKLSDKQIRALSKLHLSGVRVLPYRNRYPSSFDPKHVIGYLSQHPELLRTKFRHELSSRTMTVTDLIGGAGLEQSLDRLLHGTGPTSVSYFTDGSDKPLNGLDMRLTSPNNPYYPLKVMTTLDLSIQNAIEAYVDQQGLKEGAVVVLDAHNGDIVAMVSRPHLAVYSLHSEGSDVANHAIRAATPGSIFKLITEAAALEAKVTDEQETFICNGVYGRYGLHCWKQGGHGKLTLREALANSCNVTFAAVAERLTTEQLRRTADQLGIGRKIGWSTEEALAPLGKPLRLIGDEEAGQLFVGSPRSRDGGLLAQTGIGQRDVRLSPLQAANLVVSLLHDGRVAEPRLVSEIRYANGQRMIALPRQYAPSPYGQIAPATAAALVRGMEAVVTAGTGRSIYEGKWAVAGKSGTAETLLAGQARNNQWFTGYGPVKAPRYVVTVLSENRSTHSANQATAVFRGIMDLLADSEPAQHRK